MFGDEGEGGGDVGFEGFGGGGGWWGVDCECFCAGEGVGMRWCRERGWRGVVACSWEGSI